MSKVEPHEFVPPGPGTRDAESGWCAREDCGSVADSYAHASGEERRRFDGRQDRRGAGRTALPVIRIALAGVPSQCPHCHVPAAFPLAVTGNRIFAVCPACHCNVAPVEVTSEEDGSHCAMRLKRWEHYDVDGSPAYDRTEIVHGPPGFGNSLAPSCVLSRADEADIRDRIRALDEQQLLWALEYLALSARGWARSVEPSELLTAIAGAEKTWDVSARAT